MGDFICILCIYLKCYLDLPGVHCHATHSANVVIINFKHRYLFEYDAARLCSMELSKYPLKLNGTVVRNVQARIVPSVIQNCTNHRQKQFIYHRCRYTSLEYTHLTPCRWLVNSVRRGEGPRTETFQGGG